MRYFFFSLVASCFFSLSTVAQSPNKPMPAFVKNSNGAYSLMVDGKPFIVLGAQLWNSSSWPYILNKEWPQLKELNCNTLEAPVYWQNIEPEPGKFNFSDLDTLIVGARKTGLRLILLWFGSFKNGNSQYPPEWVQTQPNIYPRMKNSVGDELQILSTVAPPNIEADKRAFAALMRYLKQIDGAQKTVIMVQVENEAGSLGTDRDYSDAANNLFRKNVPEALTKKLGKKNGSWETVFGVQAAETFSAWYLGRYINGIAEAGKKEYALPLYTNAWQKEHGFQTPGEYPSGGPVSHMLDVWKVAAPALDCLSPDIYLSNYNVFNDLCNKYNRPDNPLFVPELGKGVDFARNMFYAIGNHHALGVAPYGIDPFHADPNDERNKEKLDDKFLHIKDNYRLFNNALEKIAELQTAGKLLAVGEDYGLREQLVSMGKYDILFSYGYPGYKKDKSLSGRALLGQLGEDEFLLIGFDTKFRFKPKYGSGFGTAELLLVEEGYYDNNTWVRKRIWNGDEVYHSTLTSEGTILKIKLRTSKKASSGTNKANFE